jgi:protein TonB
VQAIVLLVALTVFVGTPQGTQSNEQVYQPGNGVSDPVLVKNVRPVYTPDAKQRRVEGIVVLSVVVRTDGTVGDAEVTKSLDPDLDQQAVNAVRQWEFKPATKVQGADRVPVNTQVTVEMTFTLHHGPVYKVGDTGVTGPFVLKHVNPDYDTAARQEGIQGSVRLAAIVETDGTASGIRVIKSLDERLDRQAIKALGQWQFNPGRKDGAAVRVQTEFEMTFSLK